MKDSEVIQRLRKSGLELRETRAALTATQIKTGAAREIDMAVAKIGDALVAMGAS